MAVLACRVWMASIYFNIFEKISGFIQKYEDWNLDEIFVVGYFFDLCTVCIFGAPLARSSATA